MTGTISEINSDFKSTTVLANTECWTRRITGGAIEIEKGPKKRDDIEHLSFTWNMFHNSTKKDLLSSREAPTTINLQLTQCNRQTGI